MDSLLRSYWKPVFAYVRTSWSKTIEDAKDLTQAFFAYLLRKGYLSHLQAGCGSFRGYLKLALKHFLVDADRAEAARRPEGPLMSLDVGPAELDAQAPDESPERAYDREWFRCVLQDSIGTLRESLTREGKQIYFEVFQSRCLESESAGAPTYEELAARLGLTKTQVRWYLAHCRAALHLILRDRIREYVTSDEEIDREMQEVLKG